MNKPFRAWLQNKWMEHQDEMWEIDGSYTRYDPAVYFRRYKWFLKSLYKEETR